MSATHSKTEGLQAQTGSFVTGIAGGEDHGILAGANCVVEFVPVDQLTPYKGNARTHSRKQIGQIANSIERFGFNTPVLIDDSGQIIAGHGRVAAAKLLGMESVPTLRLSHLSAADKRAYIIADNRVAEKAGWDRELLSIELQALIDIDFDIELTGFETSAVDIILEDAEEAKGKPVGIEAPPSANPAIFGSWGIISSSVATPVTTTPTRNCCAARRPPSFLRIHRTTCGLTATSAGVAPSAIASSPWPAVR